MSAHVSYNRASALAKFHGPSGHTQLLMAEREAEAIARTLGLPFSISRAYQQPVVRPLRRKNPGA